MIKKYTEIKINPKDENIVFTILEMGGWFKGRNVDISEVEKYYEENNFKLNTPAYEFFSEFYNITDKFCFKAQNKITGKWSVGGNELLFDTTLSNEIFPEADEEIDFDKEKGLVEMYEPNGFVPIADSGFHLGGTLWVGNSGKYYRTYYYANNTIECYENIVEMFKHDLKLFKECPGLFISIGGYAKEWGVGGDYYMKKYIKEYGNN